MSVSLKIKTTSLPFGILAAILIVVASCTPAKSPGDSSAPQPATQQSPAITSSNPKPIPSSKIGSASPSPVASQAPAQSPFAPPYNYKPSPSPIGPVPKASPIASPSASSPAPAKCKTEEATLSLRKSGKVTTVCWDGKSHIADDNLKIESN